MKKQFLHLPLLWLLLLIGFTACQDDAESPAAIRLEEGLLVVNQGNLSQGDGSLSYIPEGSNTAQTGVYATANGKAIGGIIESVNPYKGKFYIVSNLADNILAADSVSLRLQQELESEANLTTPRNMVFSGEQAYVSVWGPYTNPAEKDYSLKQSKIAVLDLNTMKVTRSIPVPAYADRLMLIGDKLFISHTYADSLSLVNIESNELVQKVETAGTPLDFVQDANGKLWLMHAGDYGSEEGYFIQYNQQSLEEESRISLPGIVPGGRVQQLGEWVYFRTATALYRINLSAASPAPEKVLDQPGLATFLVDEVSGAYYLGVADGANPGTLLELNAEGQEVRRMQIGRFPYQILKLQ